jgi:hypothetical protein
VQGNALEVSHVLLTLREQFLAALRTAAESGLARGQKAPEIAAAMEFPGGLRPWVGRPLPRQVAQVCGFLRAK